MNNIFGLLVGAAVFLLAVGLSMNAGKIFGSDAEMAKAGLEQCPKNGKMGDAIWVKSCTEYKLTFKDQK